MKTATIFDLLSSGDVSFKNEDKGVIITRTQLPPFLYQMWQHVGDGDFKLTEEISEDQLFINWIGTVDV